MKQCPHCNTSCEDTDIVCRNCGYLFSADNIPENGEETGRQPYQPPVQPDYQQPSETPDYGFQAVPAPSGTNGMAIASFVLGLVGLLFSWCYGFGLIPGIIGLILGIVALRKISKTGQNGKGFAIAGMIIGGIGFLASIFFIIYYVMIFTNPEFQNMYKSILQQYSSSK